MQLLLLITYYDNFITKHDNFSYYKLRQVLLQNTTTHLLQITTSLLQITTSITNHDNYYKLRQYSDLYALLPLIERHIDDVLLLIIVEQRVHLAI